MSWLAKVNAKIATQRRVVREVFAHPMTRERPLRTLARAAFWKLRRRLWPGLVAVSFVDGSRLLVDSGAANSGVFFCYGIYEFEFMAFAMHLLERSDLFVDVGANLGSYTVLASAAAGCRTIAFEPAPATYQHLLRNVELNAIGSLVAARNAAVGRERGEVDLTTDQDSQNHVATAATAGGQRVRVPLVSLDEELAGKSPALIKIDVEGFEAEVIAGAQGVLAQPSLLALIVELNGSGAELGFDEEQALRAILAHGFESYDYRPETRSLTPLGGVRSSLGSTIFVRASAAKEVQRRLDRAPRFSILGRKL